MMMMDENSMSSFEEVDAESEEPQEDIEDYLDAQGAGDESGLDDDTLLQDADGVIKFNMTLQDRLTELSDMFENFGKGGLSLQNFWNLYMETYVEPVGWLALLKPRQDIVADLHSSTTSCHEQEVVEVVQINCSTLDAHVKRENGGEIFEVPLVELYPLAKQENSFLSMKITAKCLENYRFFINHLYFPWDPEDASHWSEKHLESRIQLHYDLKSGAITETMSKGNYHLQ